MLRIRKHGLCRRAVTVCTLSLSVYCVETAKDTAIVVVECEQETVPKLSNGTIFNDLE